MSPILVYLALEVRMWHGVLHRAQDKYLLAPPGNLSYNQSYSDTSILGQHFRIILAKAVSSAPGRGMG